MATIGCFVGSDDTGFFVGTNNTGCFVGFFVRNKVTACFVGWLFGLPVDTISPTDGSGVINACFEGD